MLFHSASLQIYRSYSPTTSYTTLSYKTTHCVANASNVTKVQPFHMPLCSGTQNCVTSTETSLLNGRGVRQLKVTKS